MDSQVNSQPGADVPKPRKHSVSRILQLDFLRGVAILMVLFRHSVVEFRQAGALRIPATMLNRIGWTGVDLFFVLSGFLIGGLLFREIVTSGKLDVRRFVIRRGLKIWPCYYLFLVVQAIWRIRFEANSPITALKAAVPGMLHVQNYAGTGWHTWSLAVEEHFYLLLPVLLWFLLKRAENKRVTAFPIIAALVMVCCLAIRIAVGRTGPFNEVRNYFPTHIRLDSLFAGVLLAYTYHMRPDLFARVAAARIRILVLFLIVLAPFCVFEITEHRWIWTVGYCALYTAYAGVVASLVPGPGSPLVWERFFGSALPRLVSRVGEYSYNIYLWHIFIMFTFARVVPGSPLGKLHGGAAWLVLMPCYIVAAVLVGVGVSKIVEVPTLHLRDKLFPARATAFKA